MPEVMKRVPAESLTGDAGRTTLETGEFHLGILSSSRCSAWIRHALRRKKSDFRLLTVIVCINFPAPISPGFSSKISLKRP
jgi:hypothetical protein